MKIIARCCSRCSRSKFDDDGLDRDVERRGNLVANQESGSTMSARAIATR